MELLLGFIIFLIFISLAVKVSFVLLKVMFVLVGFAVLFSLLPIIAVPAALFSVTILLIKILFIPIIIIGGMIMFLKLLF